MVVSGEDGEIEIDLAPKGELDIDLETEDGDITLSLLDEADAEFDIETGDGDIRIRGDAELQRDRENHRTGTVGRGGGRIDLRSDDGTITLWQSAAGSESLGAFANSFLILLSDDDEVLNRFRYADLVRSFEACDFELLQGQKFNWMYFAWELLPMAFRPFELLTPLFIGIETLLHRPLGTHWGGHCWLVARKPGQPVFAVEG